MTARHEVYFTCGHCHATHDLESLLKGLHAGQHLIDNLQALERSETPGLCRRLARRKIARALMRALFR